MNRPSPQGPHEPPRVLQAGVPLDQAKGGAIFVHGRGADARDILELVPDVDPGDIAYLAPQASGNTWYPYSFLAPMEQNEPGLSSGLRVIDALVRHFESAGIPSERVVLLGFSQGGCLSLECAARHVRRYGGIAGLSAGLIGPPGTPRNYTGAFDGTPVFLGCSDDDPHIPKERVVESAGVFERMGAHVTMKLYANFGHEVSEDELEHVRAMLQAVRG